MNGPRYRVRIAGIEMRNVVSIGLRFSMRELADSVSLVLADKVPIAGGDPIEVDIEGRTVLVGEVLNRRLSKSAGERTLSITGYSASQRLVKSSVVESVRVLRNISLAQIVRRIVEPYGLVADVSESALEVANEVISAIRINPGERAYDFLARVCKRQGCILVSGAASVRPDRSAKSSVRITRVAVRRSPIPITLPSPLVESIDYEDDVRDVHSAYFVTRRGRGTRADDGTLEGADGVAEDQRVPYSPLILQAEKGGRSQKALDVQAEWHMRRRAAEGQRVSLVVKTWSPNGSQALWWPNTLQRVVDVDESFDSELLLASVDLSQSAGGGAKARLELLPKDAYSVLDLPKIPPRKKPRGGSQDAAPEEGSRTVVIRQVSSDWLKQHSKLNARVRQATDLVDFDQARKDLIYKPEDPDA